MAITFGGIASGIDTEAIITSLMSIEKAPLTALQQKKTDVDSANQAISTLSTQLATLKAAAAALADKTQFASYAATTTGTGVAASISGGAAVGSYHIAPSQLAREQRSYSNTFASATDALNQTGTLTLQSGTGTPIPIEMTADDSLASVASKINSSGARVNASVLFDGTNYRLAVRALDTGAANAVTFGETGVSLGLNVAANTTQKAQDAVATVDGIEVHRPTNDFSDVIPGVKLALNAVSSAGADVTVASDPSSLESKISTFVSAYNNIVKTAHNIAGYGSAKPQVTMLASDSSVRSVLSQLSGVMQTQVANASSRFPTLASIGLESNTDGTIKLSNTKLETALAADPSGVAKLFVVDAGNGYNGAMGALKTTIDGLAGSADSLLQTRMDSLGIQSTKLQQQADAAQTKLTATQARLKAQFTAMELAYSKYQSQLSSLGVSTSSGSSKTSNSA